MANMSQSIVTNTSVNQTSITIQHVQAPISMSFTNSIGLIILAENVLTLIILYRSEKLPFQVRTLASSLTISDCMFGLGVTFPARLIQGAYR